MDIFEVLKQLSETSGPSGFEQRISAAVSELWEPLADSVSVDRLGSVIAVKQGQGTQPRPRLLLAAHLDEIGLMVTVGCRSRTTRFSRRDRFPGRFDAA